ncbi:hypothetical protein RUND412_003199 [Rhizina undulata]
MSSDMPGSIPTPSGLSQEANYVCDSFHVHNSQLQQSKQSLQPHHAEQSAEQAQRVQPPHRLKRPVHYAPSISPPPLPVIVPSLRKLMLTPNHQPRVAFFGIELASLPSAGTAPSAEHPMVNPIPLSIGIWPDTYCQHQQNVQVRLIHAAMFNLFDTEQVQSWKKLTLKTDKPCPSYTKDSIHFWYSLAEEHSHEILLQLLNCQILAQTGEKLEDPTPAREVKLLLPVSQCSKVCWNCGHWEALSERDANGNRSYRRWKRCEGCKQCFFCHRRCFDASWWRHGQFCQQIEEKYGNPIP